MRSLRQPRDSGFASGKRSSTKTADLKPNPHTTSRHHDGIYPAAKWSLILSSTFSAGPWRPVRPPIQGVGHAAVGPELYVAGRLT